MNLPLHQKVFVTTESILPVLSRSFTDTHRGEKFLSCLMRTVPGEVKKGDVLPSRFESHTINKAPLSGPFNATFSRFFVLFPGDLTI